MTPEEVRSRLAGDRTFDLWDETKQLWFCGRVVDIQSAIEGMKGPDYGVLLARLKSSLRKTSLALKPLYVEAIDYLAGELNGDMTGALMELMALEKTAKRLLAMPRPDHLIELMTEDGPECGFSGGDGPGGRRKWRNAVVTAMAHELIEDAGVAIARTGKSIYSEGSPSMKLMARVLDCLDPKRRSRKTDTVLKRVVRTRGKKAPKK
jgi:hypothetical protein